MKSIGLMIIFAGVFLVLVGLGFVFADKIPFLGKLPGDIHMKGKNWSFSFPVVTCIILSIILTVIANLIFRLFNR